MGQGSGEETEVASSSEDVERPVAPMAHMDGTRHPFPGDQPLSFLRQTAFPAHRSARSMTAPTAGLADASTPFASPASLVSSTALAEPSLQGGRAGSLLITTLTGAPKQRFLVPLSLQTILQAPKLPSLPPLGMPQPYRHPRGNGGYFFHVWYSPD